MVTTGPIRTLQLFRMTHKNVRKNYVGGPYTVEPLKVIVQEGTNGETDKELLENSPYIRFKRDVPVAHLIDDEIRRRKIQVTEEMHIDSFAAVIRMVSFGLGVGIVPEQVADNTFPKNIRAIPFGNPPIQRRNWCYPPRELHENTNC